MKDATPLRELIMGFRTTQLLHVAARLGLADRLRDGPRTAHALAPLLGAHPRALHRLMRALVVVGVLDHRGDDGFALAPLGDQLRSDRPDSLHALAVLYGERWLWQAYGAMFDSVRTGAAAFPRVHGLDFFDYLAENPEAGASFDAAMSGYSASEATALADAYAEFGTMQHIVDVGGGRGALLRTLLDRFGNLRATLFDRAAVVAGVSDGDPRLARVPGDFFKCVEPAGADAYLLKSVIHDWSDDDALTILRACRHAMTPHSRLLLIERVLPDDDPKSAPDAVLFDINMLVTLGACERTRREYATLFAAAGLRATRFVPTACPLTIIEARVS